MQSILTAARSGQIDSLACDSLPWYELEDFSRRHALFLPLGRVKKLELTFQGAGTSLSPSSTRSRAFANLIHALQGIEDLTLNLDAPGNGHGGRALWGIVLRHRWQRLRKVHFHDVVTTETELLSFTAGHQAYLKDLSFSDIRLHNHSSGAKGNPDSIIRTLWTIPFLASLKAFQVEGYVSCCGKEHWAAHRYFAPKSKDPPLLSEVQEYVCRRARFPFPQLLAPLAFGRSIDAQKLPYVQGENYRRTQTLSGILATDDNAPKLLSKVEKHQLLESCGGLTWMWEEEGMWCEYLDYPELLVGGTAEADSDAMSLSDDSV